MKYVDKSFSSNPPNDAYRRGWERIAWSNRETGDPDVVPMNGMMRMKPEKRPRKRR